RPGITAWMDYRASHQTVASAGYRIRGVLGVHDVYDLALLDVEPPQLRSGGPTPLALAPQAPPRLESQPVGLAGFPRRHHPPATSDPAPAAGSLRAVYRAKRAPPGVTRGVLSSRAVKLPPPACAPLALPPGGAPLVWETHHLLGLPPPSRSLKTATAVPLWVL